MHMYPGGGGHYIYPYTHLYFEGGNHHPLKSDFIIQNRNKSDLDS